MSEGQSPPESYSLVCPPCFRKSFYARPISLVKPPWSSPPPAQDALFFPRGTAPRRGILDNLPRGATWVAVREARPCGPPGVRRIGGGLGTRPGACRSLPASVCFASNSRIRDSGTAVMVCQRAAVMGAISLWASVARSPCRRRLQSCRALPCPHSLPLERGISRCRRHCHPPPPTGPPRPRRPSPFSSCAGVASGCIAVLCSANLLPLSSRSFCPVFRDVH